MLTVRRQKKLRDNADICQAGSMMVLLAYFHCWPTQLIPNTEIINRTQTVCFLLLIFKIEDPSFYLKNLRHKMCYCSFHQIVENCGSTSKERIKRNSKLSQSLEDSESCLASSVFNQAFGLFSPVWLKLSV